jgi:hypothetical protein
MSDFTSYTVSRSSGQVPYISSTSELGYFNSTGYINNSNWYSLGATMFSNNGIASIAGNGGIYLKHAGFYRLNVGINLQGTGGGGQENTLSFSFGTTQLTSSTDAIGSFGGAISSGNFSYSNDNTNIPGIISWVTNAFSSDNGSTSILSKTNNNYVIYRWFGKANNNGSQAPGLCSTQMTFYVNTSGIIIFLNINCNRGFTMGRSYFTLELLSNQTV